MADKMMIKPNRSDDTSGEEENWKSRYGNLRAHSAKEKNEWQQKEENYQAQIEDLKKNAKPNTPAEVEAWIKENPTIAAVVESIADTKAKDFYNQSKADLEAQTKDVRTNQAVLEIKKVYPNFDQIKESDDFHDWVENQSRWVQDAVYVNEDDAKGVIRVLDLYDLDKGKVQNLANETLEAAKAVNVASRPTIDPEKPTFLESEVARMSMQEYEAKEVDIKEAIKDGRFTYDLSAKRA